MTAGSAGAAATAAGAAGTTGARDRRRARSRRRSPPEPAHRRRAAAACCSSPGPERSRRRHRAGCRREALPSRTAISARSAAGSSLSTGLSCRGWRGGAAGAAAGRHREADRFAHRRHALRPILGPQGKAPVDALEQLRAVASRRVALHQRLVAVLHHATHRGRRLALGDHEVHHCRQGVHVGPRPLLHARHVGVLLDRRIAGLEDHRQRVRHVADDTARSAEVEQHGAVVGEQQDVVGRDVPVVDLVARAGPPVPP